jgi:hypothetical protein
LRKTSLILILNLMLLLRKTNHDFLNFIYFYNTFFSLRMTKQFNLLTNKKKMTAFMIWYFIFILFCSSLSCHVSYQSCYCIAPGKEAWNSLYKIIKKIVFLILHAYTMIGLLRSCFS